MPCFKDSTSHRLLCVAILFIGCGSAKLADAQVAPTKPVASAPQTRLNMPGIGFDHVGPISRWPAALFQLSTEQQQHLLGSLRPASAFEREARTEFEERRLAASRELTRHWDGQFVSPAGIALFEPHLKDRDAVIDDIADRYKRALWSGAEGVLTESQIAVVPLMAGAIRRGLILSSCRTYLPEAGHDPVPFVLRRFAETGDPLASEAGLLAVIAESYNSQLNSAASDLLRATSRHSAEYAEIAGGPSRSTPEARRLKVAAWRKLHNAELRVARIHDRVVDDLCKALRPDVAGDIRQEWDRLKYPVSAEAGADFLELLPAISPHVSTEDLQLAIQEAVLGLRELQRRMRAVERETLVSFATSGTKFHHVTDDARESMISLRRQREQIVASLLVTRDGMLKPDAPEASKQALQEFMDLAAAEAEFIQHLADEASRQNGSWPSF